GRLSQFHVILVTGIVVEQRVVPVLVCRVLVAAPALGHLALFHVAVIRLLVATAVAARVIKRSVACAARCRSNTAGRRRSNPPIAQGRQDSNLQPAVLETAALPIAPRPWVGCLVTL